MQCYIKSAFYEEETIVNLNQFRQNIFTTSRKKFVLFNILIKNGKRSLINYVQFPANFYQFSVKEFGNTVV